MANISVYQLRVNPGDTRVDHQLSIAECIQRDTHGRNSGISVGSRVNTLLRFEQLVAERLGNPQHTEHEELVPNPATPRLTNRVETGDTTQTIPKLKEAVKGLKRIQARLGSV